MRRDAIGGHATRKDLTKEVLYESVKTIIETEDARIHFPQQKLFTLFSIAFQTMLYHSTKRPGIYLIRVEDGILADKMAKKAKDDTSRRFFEKLLIPRKLKYGESTFYLDFFDTLTWNNTNELPKERFREALVIKNTMVKPLEEIPETTAIVEKKFYLTSLLNFVPKVYVIAFAENFSDLDFKTITFPFITESDEEKAVKGVRLSKDVDLHAVNTVDEEIE